MAIGGAAGYEYIYMRPQVPANITSQAEIPILYPEKLPTGFRLVKSSFNINNGNIIGYYVQNAAGNRIVFTNQAKPSNFDYEKFYTTGLSNTNRFNTALGSGAVGTTNGRIFGSFTTSKSWVIATSNSKSVTTDMIQYCLTYLKQAN